MDRSTAVQEIGRARGRAHDHWPPDADTDDARRHDPGCRRHRRIPVPGCRVTPPDYSARPPGGARPARRKGMRSAMEDEPPRTAAAGHLATSRGHEAEDTTAPQDAPCGARRAIPTNRIGRRARTSPEPVSPQRRGATESRSHRPPANHDHRRRRTGPAERGRWCRLRRAGRRPRRPRATARLRTSASAASRAT